VMSRSSETLRGLDRRNYVRNRRTFVRLPTDLWPQPTKRYKVTRWSSHGVRRRTVIRSIHVGAPRGRGARRKVGGGDRAPAGRQTGGSFARHPGFVIPRAVGYRRRRGAAGVVV